MADYASVVGNKICFSLFLFQVVRLNIFTILT
jgi:hypothetical protein